MAQEVEDDYVQGHLHWNQIHVTEHQITLSVFYEESERESPCLELWAGYCIKCYTQRLGTVLSDSLTLLLSRTKHHTAFWPPDRSISTKR